jgi:Arc/MetJ-type ribon-helix-helix transcriptional regulator
MGAIVSPFAFFVKPPSTSKESEMPSNRAIGQLVSVARQVKTGEFANASFTSVEREARAATGDEEAARWFDAACAAANIKALILADGLGVRESYLSEMRTGKRSVPLRSLRTFRQNREAVRAFVTAMLEDLAPGAFELREREQLTAEEAEDDVAGAALDEPVLREVLIRKAAQRSGRSVEEYERVLRIAK